MLLSLAPRPRPPASPPRGYKDLQVSGNHTFPGTRERCAYWVARLAVEPSHASTPDDVDIRGRVLPAPVPVRSSASSGILSQLAVRRVDTMAPVYDGGVRVSQAPRPFGFLARPQSLPLAIRPALAQAEYRGQDPQVSFGFRSPVSNILYLMQYLRSLLAM